MEAYQGFAQVYDLFMSDIQYEEWAEYICSLLSEYGFTDGLMLDLGCGTGTMTRLLANRGYDMIGVDCSAEMLQIAMEYQSEQLQEILYLQQDMREFELYGTVRAVVSICDSMNYLLEVEELEQVCSLVNNYLDPGGIFIFDVNTRYKYEALLGDSVIAENREDGSFIWENYYDPDSQMNEYDLTLFIREEDDRYQKYEETHYQRAYDLNQITGALVSAGLKLEAVYDAFTRNPPHEESERIYIIASEQMKEDKKRRAL